MRSKDLLSISDLTAEDIWQLLTDALDMKKGDGKPLLSGATLALLFEKPSLRTRVSFDAAMHQLGGHTIYLSHDEVGLGEREAISDVARVLSRYVNIIAARTYSHQTLEQLAHYAAVPVLNALSDVEHPCQALGDLLTIYEKRGRLQGLTLAFVGDGNNVASSLLLAASLMGVNFNIASPRGYEIRDEVLQQAQEFASSSAARISCVDAPHLAVRDADVIYTDVWTSMGQEAEAEQRRMDFANYQVDANLLALAGKEVIVMHPLPAHHGEEVADGLLDLPQSVVFDQAENRMHIQKAILAKLTAVNG